MTAITKDKRNVYVAGLTLLLGSNSSAHLPRTPSCCRVNPGSKDMPSQHDVEMPNDHQTFVVIGIVKAQQ